MNKKINSTLQQGESSSDESICEICGKDENLNFCEACLKSLESYNNSYVYETDKCELCGKDEDLKMCEECQSRYLLKIPHRNLTTCGYGHFYEKCPNAKTYRHTGSMYDCSGESEHCPVCKYDIPYTDFLAYLQTNIRYLNLLKKYMDEGEANECWYCWPCL